MMIPPVEQRAYRKPLRLWPGVIAVALQWLLRSVVPVVVPEAGVYPLLGSFAAGFAVIVWWAFFSRAPRSERLGAILVMIAAMAATPSILHPSIGTGMRGVMFFMYAFPVLCLAFVLWAVATRNLSDRIRRVTMVATILLSCGAWALLRSDGITGEGSAQFAWRWSRTPEQQLLARTANEPSTAPPAAADPVRQPVPAPARKEPAALPPAPAAAETKESEPEAGADWPGFRGPGRDGVVRNTRINTDWSSSPPVELWRRPVGPGWSSFAVHRGLLYTQEQRGEHEVVACYKLRDGQPVWTHQDPTRFWEANAGAGPRATPTIRNGRVYTFGATGIVNALDARTGSVIWSRNAATDTNTEVPGWGFASSPLVVDDLVFVAASGTLVAYEIDTGQPRWTGPSSGGSYSSPQLFTIDGVPHVLLLSGAGVTSVSPADGKLLWQHSWKGSAILQPAFTEDRNILVANSDAMGGLGTRRIHVTRGPGGWTVEEGWTSAGLKPYFNDFVVHKGHAFGFDGRILACIDVADGKRKWKGGRYGHGQFVLLADQDLLLVLSEEGELALVKATADQFTELARYRAIEGKTWNHPVLAGDVVLTRNAEEMAAFRLSRPAPLKGTTGE
jgi:outer membrane protein assembly factor BamB